MSSSGKAAVGHDAIRQALSSLVNQPKTYETRLNYSVVNSDTGLARADFRIVHEAKVVLASSSVEVLPRQPDGNWLFVIDHAAGASLPPGLGRLRRIARGSNYFRVAGGQAILARS